MGFTGIDARVPPSRCLFVMERSSEDILRIAVVGPESSGKSTLCSLLAERLEAPRVDEFARAYLGRLGRPYVEGDLLHIARGQCAWEDAAALRARRLIVCDTDMITIRIWSEEKFGRCHPWIIQQSEHRSYDLWLLCAPDIPWEADPLRENPHDRDRLFEVYEKMLIRLGKPYRIIRGAHEERLQAALLAIAEHHVMK